MYKYIINYFHNKIIFIIKLFSVMRWLGHLLNDFMHLVFVVFKQLFFFAKWRHRYGPCIKCVYLALIRHRYAPHSTACMHVYVPSLARGGVTYRGFLGGFTKDKQLLWTNKIELHWAIYHSIVQWSGLVRALGTMLIEVT